MTGLRITSPTKDSDVKGVVTIRVTALGIEKVSFWIDGIKKGVDFNAPFSFDWHTERYTNGYHSIKVISGNGKYSDSARYRVSNPVPEPVPPPTHTTLVSISGPAQVSKPLTGKISVT